MKFERLMKIYWTRGLFYEGKLLKPDWSIKQMFNNLAGMSLFTKKNYIKRFEITTRQQDLIKFNEVSRNKKKIINMYISKITNTSNKLLELIRYNLIRLYLIKTFRGRAQYLGKPSRGQRTWSNAWTAFNYNKILRSFVNEVLKNKKTDKKPRKFDYKTVKRKLRKLTFRRKIPTIKTKNLWF